MTAADRLAALGFDAVLRKLAREAPDVASQLDRAARELRSARELLEHATVAFEGTCELALDELERGTGA